MRKKSIEKNNPQLGKRGLNKTVIGDVPSPTPIPCKQTNATTIRHSIVPFQKEQNRKQQGNT